jgi:hypothetical protein
MAVSIKMTAFWVFTSCSLVEVDRPFRGASSHNCMSYWFPSFPSFKLWCLALFHCVCIYSLFSFFPSISFPYLLLPILIPQLYLLAEDKQACRWPMTHRNIIWFVPPAVIWGGCILPTVIVPQSPSWCLLSLQASCPSTVRPCFHLFPPLSHTPVCVPTLRCQSTSTRLHSTISQKTAILN